MKLEQIKFSLAEVRCEHCLKKFKLRDIQINDVITCSSCGHSNPIVQRDKVTLIEFDRDLVRPTSSVQIQRQGSVFIIEKKWSSRSSKLLVGLALLWNLGWMGILWASRNYYLPPDLLTLNSLSKNLLVFGGLILVLWAFRSSFNRTRILIKNRKLIVSTSPLDWKSLLIIPIDQIKELKFWKDNPKSGLPSFRFSVDLELIDGRTLKLCPARDCNEAAYIEKTLEEFLRIERAPIIVDPLVA